MAYIYKIRKKKKITDPELQRLKNEIELYENIILEMDETLNSSGKKYDKLVRLNTSLEKSFDSIVKTKHGYDLTGRKRIKESMDDMGYEYSSIIDYENKMEKTKDNYAYTFIIGMGTGFIAPGILLMLGQYRLVKMSDETFLALVMPIYFSWTGGLLLAHAIKRTIGSYRSHRKHGKNMEKHSEKIIKNSKPFLEDLKKRLKT